MSDEVGSVDAAPAVDSGSSEAAPISDWKSGLEGELGSDPSLADIRDVNGLAKSYIHAQKMIGADKVTIPGEDAASDEWSNFYDRLGRPESYELSRPTLAEGLEYNDEMETHMKTIMHQSGLTQRQANDLYTGYMEYLSGQHQQGLDAGKLQMEEWNNEAKREFGKAYNERVDLAQRAATEFGGEEFLTWLDQTGQGNNPMLIRLFSKVGQQMMESSSNDGRSSQDFLLTPESAQQEIGRLQRDPSFMKQYHNKDHDGHTAAVQKMDTLHTYAYPEDL